MTPLKAGILLHWAAVTLYILSTVAYAAAATFSRESLLKKGWWLALAGLLPHSAALALRWYATGHGPYMAKYEVFSSNAWVAVLMFLVFSKKIPRLRAAGYVVLPASFLMMTAGLFTSPELRFLPPSLRSFWLVLHTVFAKLAVGGILIAVGASILYLVRERKGGAEAASLPALDDYAGRFAGFGFIFWTIMTAAGAIWANETWGRYWGWDPIETWSLITWLLFGSYLHGRRSLGWRGGKAAWVLLGCFVLSLATVFVIPFVFDTLHGEYFR
ncbi:MAG: cytochrome c biogenesis protein CcsA [Elusimicrobia bacterium]|nr:cytochrome c biogenesis protein CcsA [Elusimicrobiota bacterium]